MRIDFIKKTAGSGRLILIFAGWGSDAKLYSEIDVAGWDTAVVWGYSDLSFPAAELSGYTTIYLYAWSMGVWAASSVTFPFPPDAAFAINGTERPRSDTHGIPEAIYDGTLDGLDHRSLKKFRLRMAGSSQKARELDELLPTPNIDVLKKELEFIRANPAKGNISWDRAFIGNADRIFPAEAQKNYWETKGVETFISEDAHYPDFKKILSRTLHDMERVGRRFGKALSTYDHHATAQRSIARHLSEMIAERETEVGGKALEIGSGSGMFTSLWIPVLKASEADFIDLYPTPQYGAAPIEHHHIADAEQWLRQEAMSHPGSFDAIVSASTIQWFASTRSFFRNASLLLREGGLLAVSSFTKGNLRELDTLRPSPIVYLTATRLRQLAEQWFSDVKVEEREYTLSFPTSRELLLHLKHTGVGGSAVTGSQGSGLSQMLRSREDGNFPLTYRAVFITGVASGHQICATS